MRSQLKMIMEFFFFHSDLNNGPQEPKGGVLPMSYTDLRIIYNTEAVNLFGKINFIQKSYPKKS